jgi:hypothetical protein
MYTQSLLVALLCLGTIASASAELQPPNPSERTQCEFQDHANVTVEYGSMRMKGRKVFGGLVPYGKIWETGYKRSTTFVTSANLAVGGKEVTAGQYSLLTIPGPDKWTMVLKKMSSKDRSNGTGEIAGIDLLMRQLPSPLESFTISFDQYRGGCVLNLRWEQTEASVLVAEKK